MADGSDYEVTKRGQSSTVKPKKSAFGFENPVMVAVAIVLTIVLAVFYSTQIGFQPEKPAWACNWALLIFANIALSIFVLRLTDAIDNKKPEPGISARNIFIISLGVVITVGLYVCIELFVVLKPALPKIIGGNWKTDFGFHPEASQATEQNNVVRLLAMTIYNSLHHYSAACDGINAGKHGVELVGELKGKTYGCVQDKTYIDFLWWYVPALLTTLVLTIAAAFWARNLAKAESKGGKKSLLRIGDTDADTADADFIARIRQALADKQAELLKLRQTYDTEAGARKTVEGQIADLKMQLSVLEADLSCVETAAAEMARIKAQADALEQKLAPCIAGLSGATVAVFQDVMKIFAKARQDLGIAPQGLSAHATALRKKIDEIKARIGGTASPVTDTAARIARLEGEIEALTTWLKASDARVKPSLKTVELDEHDQVVIPGLLVGGRYKLSEISDENPAHPLGMLIFATVLLTVNNFAIAPEISPAVNPGDWYPLANIAVLAALGALTFVVLNLFRRRDATTTVPWLSWLITAGAVLLSIILAWIIAHLPPPPGPVVILPPPPPAIQVEPMTVSCEMATNLNGKDGKAGRATIAWTFGSPEQISLFEAAPAACRIALKDDPEPKYAVAVGIASQEGGGDQFALSAQRAARLADVFQSQHDKAKVYLLVVGKHKQDGHDVTPVKPDPLHLATSEQRQAVLLGGNIDKETNDSVLLFNEAIAQLKQRLPLGEYPLQCFYQRDSKTSAWTVVQTTPKDAAGKATDGKTANTKPADTKTADTKTVPPECPAIP